MVSLPMVVAFIAAFLLAALPGRAFIARLSKVGAKQNVSEDAPSAHGKKQGTPTMGGLLILFALTAVVIMLLCYQQFLVYQQRLSPQNIDPVSDVVIVPPNYSTLLPLLLLTLGFGGIGFADDYLSLVRGKNLGLRAREKFAAQCLIGVGFVCWLAFRTRPDAMPATWVSLLPPHLVNEFTAMHFTVDLGQWYYPLALLFIVGFSNATNFTDGLDGLSSGLTIIISLTLAALMEGVFRPDLAIYCLALAGALAGFLWWNAHPARVFMGDTCSLALGAALAGVALLGRMEIGLIIASLVCWAELISVMIQVSVFKYRKARHGIEYARAHRVFRRTPLHHHFEEAGWAETQVVTRFWLVGALCAALALLWGRNI